MPRKVVYVRVAAACNVSSVQTQAERDELYKKFVKAIHEVEQKSNFKNLLLEKKLTALADSLEKKEAQLNEVLSASNLDPTALTVVTRKLEVREFICVSLKSNNLFPSTGDRPYENGRRCVATKVDLRVCLSAWGANRLEF